MVYMNVQQKKNLSIMAHFHHNVNKIKISQANLPKKTVHNIQVASELLDMLWVI